LNATLTRAVVLIAVISSAIIAGCTSAGQASAPAGVSAAAGGVSVACKDSTSDASTLQNAINSSAPGADISIEGGTCLLTSGITLLGDRTYSGGNTAGTVLKQDGAMGYVLASASYVNNQSSTGDPLAIRDLTVLCNRSGNTDGIIVLNWHVDVQHVDVQNCGGSGIVDTNTGAAGAAIHNTSVNSRFDNNFISGNGRYGFYVHDSGNSVTDGFFDDNLIASSGADGIHFDDATGWDISGNHLYGNRQNAIVANRLYGTTVSNNYIEDFGDNQHSGTWYGIVGTAQGSVGSTIFNNKIVNDAGETAGARYVYVAVQQANYGTAYLSVTGNVIVGDRPSDVGFSFAAGAHQLAVTSGGNEVSGVGAARSDGGGVVMKSGI
jgi:parallel beta-helix repeat protein